MMRTIAKYIVLMIAIVGQIVGIVFLFIDISKALTFYVFYMVAIVLLFALLVWERKREKEEDGENDYRDY
ncbi:hypothetical protein [Bacillus sp. REN16]|uniref:hypothetical protein n=1 Tax=Bacillus sp. REN16 TaxID=2887296 RepID=UPI001E48BE92|nr:hypothetical protein [Bacillus sp. REN16]MCC3355392.1 hypothetical protein [Bacillus sp. REN16]